MTEHPLFGYPNVVVTPHLGASTAEATDRAGYQAAEQVVAALTGGVVTSAVNVPAVAAEDLEALGPFLPLAREPRPDRGRAWWRAPRSTRSRSSTAAGSPSATRACSTVQMLKGALAGHTEEDVNEVNAPAIAEERGIAISQTNSSYARDFTDLVRVTVRSGDDLDAGSSGRRSASSTTLICSRPGARASTCSSSSTWRSSATRTGPACLGGSAPMLGEAGINIVSAAVGRQPSEEASGGAVMLVTADSPVPKETVDRIVAGDGFVAGRTISL